MSPAAGFHPDVRILLSSLSGNDKTESVHWRRVLARLGHEVRWASVPGRGGDHPGLHACQGFALGTSFEEVVAASGGVPDLFLYVEPFGLIPEGVERATCPTACLLSDVHGDLPSRQRMARFFDHVFLYHRNYLHAFSEHPSTHLHWLPCAVDSEMFKPLPVPRDLDLGFVGLMFQPGHERRRVMADLARRWTVNEQRYYLQEEIPGIYSRSKIVVNLPFKDDLNFRFFEALSCGAMLLTRRIDTGQELLFTEGVHYAAFADDAELIEKITYYLSHDAEREAIAAAGHAEVLKHHGLNTRLTTLLDTVRSNPAPVAPARSMSRAQLDVEYAWLYEYWRSLDAGARVVAEARHGGRPWLGLTVPVLRTLVRSMK
jgi:hypothetical protein